MHPCENLRFLLTIIADLIALAARDILKGNRHAQVGSAARVG